MGALALGIGLLAFAFADYLLDAPHRATMLNIKLGLLAVVAALPFVLRRCRDSRSGAAALFVAELILALGVTAQSRLLADNLTTPTVLLILVMATALLIPWGVGWQIGLAVVCGVIAGLEAWPLAQTHGAAFAWPALGMAIGYAVSIYIAYESGARRKELRARQSELDDRNEQYRTLLRSSGAIAYEIDTASMEVLFLGADIEALLGYPNDEWIRNVDLRMSAVHPDDLELASATSGRIAEFGGEATIEYRMLASDGRVLWFRDHLSAVLGKDGKPVTVEGFAFEITELRDANTRLEERVADRTALLRSALQELEAFSYSVSHDLRAPLRRIDGFASVAEDEAGDANPILVDSIGRIRESARSMERLITSMLEFSRAIRGGLARRDVKLHELAIEILDSLGKTDQEREVDVVVAPVPDVQADPALIRVAMDNLLGNAWKYTTRSPEAKIEFGSIPSDEELVFFVRDNGVGFNAAYADKLFEPFERLHSERDFQGTGIGLATVRRVLRRHGGDIWAEGSEGDGATFFFTIGNVDRPSLPRADAAAG